VLALYAEGDEMVRPRTQEDVEDARRVERSLAAVRWFAVVFGFFQVWQSTNLAPQPPHSVVIRGYTLIAVLAVGNVFVTIAARHARRPSDIRLVALLAFSLDICLVTGIIWNFSKYATGTTWAAGYILVLEGALRYRMTGALAASGAFAVSETLREWYLAVHEPGYHADAGAVTFRIGIGVLIGLFAGMMARSLAREAEKAQERAAFAEEAAARSTAARRELDVLHSAVLAGLASDDLHEALGSMADEIGRDLGFEICLILLRDEESPDMRPVGVYGLSDDVKERAVHPDEGLIGSVLATGRPLLARDVTTITGYVVFDPRVRAKVAVPLRAGGETLGVLDVETFGQFDDPDATLDLMTRLADQIALVVHSVRLRARQQEMLERLSELDRMKSDFVAITSHELRTPLTAIRGFVKTMIHNADRLSSADMQDFLGIVDRQSHRLARLVEDLLMASKIEAGELSIVPEAVAPVSFLGTLLSTFGENAERIKLEVDGDIPESVVFDPYRMEQVLRNLLHNAIKFSPPTSSITLGTRFAHEELVMWVRDLGVGISPEEQTKVFERFHQAGDSLTRQTEGAGLGLYITKRLVEAMGGTIELRSHIGRGSTFTVRLPSTVSTDPVATIETPEADPVVVSVE
jgi:signal transduction histidine kinase